MGHNRKSLDIKIVRSNVHKPRLSYDIAHIRNMSYDAYDCRLYFWINDLDWITRRVYIAYQDRESLFDQTSVAEEGYELDIMPVCS